MSAEPSGGVLFARQPIYDRQLVVRGYELLFRPLDGGPINPADFDGNRATSQVLLNAFTVTDIHEACEGRPAWVNFTAETLQQGLPFSPETLIIEVLEDIKPDEAVINTLKALKKRGFRLALDDYNLPGADHPLLALADIVKLEFPAYSASELHSVTDTLRQHSNARLLAEKIETEEDFASALEAGCTLFQGYYLARPQTVHGRTIPVSRVNLLALLAQLNAPDISLRNMALTIQNDPFLSVRLLRLANSVWAEQRQPVTSLNAAVTKLGLTRIRSLASLLLLARFEEKPHALQRMAMLRAHFCQHLAAGIADDKAEMGFTIGLFSMLDSFIDQPLKQVLEVIHVHPLISAALLERSGSLGLILQTVIDYQNASWRNIEWSRLAELGISANQVSRCYQLALQNTSRDALVSSGTTA
ncbi:EAL and HDOD domain-containing protein [Kushneria aurantia]|uniref:EAL and HDOD domain-containing protein n=1 Tax=Kushneria aurantia TaxID=504092 RepID=A0ABV6G839_9GAMM|nr:HDOD domain-containing protein [Kushneria aurantia]